MLTYKSLQSNSEAIACDVAEFLFSPNTLAPTPNGPNPLLDKNKGTYQPVTTGCASLPPGRQTGVIVLSSSGKTLANFQAWRTNMAIIRQLDARSSSYCEKLKSVPPGTKAMGIFPFTPTGVGGEIEGILKLFATNEAATGLTGTIKDEALMGGVGRQLRALNVPVLLPDLFSPFSLGRMDFSKSPLMSSLLQLLEKRSCVKSYIDEQKGKTKEDEASEFLGKLDKFIEGVTTAPGTTPTAPSAIAAALSADDFARAIGANPDGSFSTDSPWKHVLMLKALESGGSQIGRAGIFGSKLHFTGGAVTTYALFTLDGKLACSGNAYAYGGDVRPKYLTKHSLEPNLDPSQQLIFLRGRCAPE
jgi:hypothetical protein